MKKMRIVPLSIAAITAMSLGISTTFAKAYDENAIKEFALREVDGETVYDNVYIIGKHMFKGVITVDDIMTGARTLADGEANVIYRRSNTGTWSNAVTNTSVSAPEKFDILVAAHKYVEDEDLKAALAELIETAQEIVENSSHYTDIASVEAALGKDATDDSERQAKYDALQAAINELVFSNKSTLDNALKTYDKVEADYTTSSWSSYNEQLATVKNMPETTYEEIEAKISELQKIVPANILVSETVNKDALNTLVSSEASASRVEENYTATTWSTYKTAYDKAVEVNSSTSAVNSEVTDAYNNLNAAVKALVKQSIYDAYAAAVNAANLTESEYTQETWSVLAAALKVTPTTQTEYETATNNIKSAIGELVFEGQKEYDDLVAEIDKLVSTDYTDKSWTAFAASKDGYIVDSFNTYAELVETSSQLAKIKSLLVQKTADLTELNNAISAANQKNSTDYSNWSTVGELLTSASSLSKNSLQSVVTKTAGDINSAVGDLTPIKSTTEIANLTSLLEEIDKLESSDYSNWSSLETAMEGDLTEDSLKSVVQAKIDTITAAKSGLVQKTADLTELDNAISAANQKISTDYSNWENVESLLTSAGSLSENSLQSVVTKAAEDINSAVDALTPIKSTTEIANLTSLLEEIDKLVSTDYSNWSSLETAMEGDLTEDSLKSVVQAKIDTITAAKSGLDKVDADTSRVEPTIQAITEKGYVESDYEDKSWAALQSAIATAESMTKENLQSEVDAAITAITTQVGELKQKEANLTSLQKTMNHGLKESNYTVASWEKLSAAVEAAETLNNKSKQSIVDAAEQAIKDAIDALVAA